MKKQFFIGCLLPLIVGGLIYILFRKSSLLMFYWSDLIGLNGIIENLRNITIPLSKSFPEWFLFSFPDGLWMFSYISFVLSIWNNLISKQSIFWLLFLPFLAIFSELGQSLGIINGTFDIVDLFFYVLGCVLPFLIFKKKLTKELI